MVPLERGTRMMAYSLPVRNALNQFDDVQSEELIAGTGGPRPLLSIMIPTYRRFDLLREAVASALAQDFDAPIEVVVVDDDPASSGHERLLKSLAEGARADFRYLRNTRNLGMYSNINRCVESARGEWISILHDDDLIDPSFAREMFGFLSANPRVDGLICQKRGLDQRPGPFEDSFSDRTLRRAMQFHQFGGRKSRPIMLRKLFWGCIIGNTVGFICRTQDMKAIGGFHLEEFPSSDYFFYARFAERFHLRELRKTLATIRVADNSLLRPEVQLSALSRNFELQRALAGTALPRWWARLSPLIVARQLKVTARFWQSDLSRADFGRRIGIRIPRDHSLFLFAMRAVLGGF